MINVLVWNEFEHERIDDAVKEIYPNGIHRRHCGIFAE